MNSMDIAREALQRAIESNPAPPPPPEPAEIADLRAKLREECDDCETCTTEEADVAPAEALAAWLRGESTEPWWGGVRPAWNGHLREEWRTT